MTCTKRHCRRAVLDVGPTNTGRLEYKSGSKDHIRVLVAADGEFSRPCLPAEVISQMMQPTCGQDDGSPAGCSTATSQPPVSRAGDPRIEDHPDLPKDKPVPDIVPADEKWQESGLGSYQVVRSTVTEIVCGQPQPNQVLSEAFDWNSIARQSGDAQGGATRTTQVYNLAAGPSLAYGGGSNSFAALNSKATPLGNGAAVFSAPRYDPTLPNLLAATQAGGIPKLDSFLLEPVRAQCACSGNNTYQASEAVRS